MLPKDSIYRKKNIPERRTKRGDSGMTNPERKNEMGFIGYEYKDQVCSKEMSSVYLDGYPNFGWIPEDTALTSAGAKTISIRFKRDRKIRNKAELTRLQRQFDACADEIVRLTRAETSGAAILAFTIGLLGTAFLAGATFAYLGGLFPLMVLLAIPGFAGWILPYFCYRNSYDKKCRETAPLIERKYDEIYDVCEKANRLLSAAAE